MKYYQREGKFKLHPRREILFALLLSSFFFLSTFIDNTVTSQTFFANFLARSMNLKLPDADRQFLSYTSQTWNHMFEMLYFPTVQKKKSFYRHFKST